MASISRKMAWKCGRPFAQERGALEGDGGLGCLGYVLGFLSPSAGGAPSPTSAHCPISGFALCRLEIRDKCDTYL